jgi:Domain of unknown function (DUF5134)
MMISPPGLLWSCTAVFVLPGLFYLGRGLLRGAAVARVSDGLHVLMCVGMITMLVPGGVDVPVLGQVAVFGAGTLWFAGLVFLRFDHDECGAHAHHALMMAGMMWMSATMALGAHGHSGLFTVPGLVAAFLAALFLVGGAAVLVRSFPHATSPLPVAADALMSLGMAVMTVSLIG